MEHEIESRKVKIRTVLSSLLVIMGCVLILTVIVIYTTGVDNRFTRLVERIVPLPAVIINRGNFITLGELRSNVQSVKRFYETQDFSQIGLRVDFSTDEGKIRLKIKEKSVLNKMIEDRVVEILAKQRGLTISDAIVDENVNRKLREYGSEQDVKQNLADQYNWSIEDFKDKVVKPNLYRDELQQLLESQDQAVGEADRKIHEADAKLSEGASFGDVARDYSEGVTASQNGDLGWFRIGQLVPEVASSVSLLEPGKRSEVIRSELGFHIIELQGRRVDEEKGEQVQVRQIFVRIKPFSQRLEELMRGITVSIPLKEYEWNSETLTAQFTSEAMRQEEAKVIEQSQGDPSLLFWY